MPYLVLCWMMLAAVGGGLVVLRALGLQGTFTQIERVVIAFIIGIGVIGWLVFFPGIAHAFNAKTFAVILTVLSAGIVFARSPAKENPETDSLSKLEWLILAGIAIAMTMDLFEGLSPAADGDTMAYHFETPRLFLAEGMIYAIPRALDGLTQLLVQMTYAVAMGLGGKAAVPLWTMVSGWGLGALFYVIAGRHMPRVWALAGTLCLLTTPAIVYSAGTGQVEVRIASFALLSAYAAILSGRINVDPRTQMHWVVLAGIVAGFCIGGKLSGLIFAFVVCISMAGGRNALSRMIVFSAVAGVVGMQWYIFNWIETGDPLFPVFWQYVDLSPNFPWNKDIAAAFGQVWVTERPEPITLGWYLMYPIRTIIAPLPSFESLRTGVGPAVLVTMPFAALAVIQTRSVFQSLIFRLLVICFLFYTIWYFIGPSLRVRHLLSVYPLLLLCTLAGAARYLQNRPRTNFVICASFAAMLCLQIAGQAIFSKKFIQYLTTDTTESEYFEKNISGYRVVDWLNQNLKSDQRVMVLNREWLYLLDVPHFFAHPSYQALVEIYPEATDLHRFIDQLKAQGITHIAIPDNSSSSDSISRFMNELGPRGCLTRIREIDSFSLSSRTLPQLGRNELPFIIYSIKPSECRID
jgi:hypothetical protein